MEKTLYSFNPSQDVVHLQTKYTLFKRVENILFSTVVEGGFDQKLMTQALNLLIERNDCLRIKFIKKDGKILQFFEDQRTIGDIPFVEFKTWAQSEAFYKKFRRHPLNCFKGKVLQAIYAKNPAGEHLVYFKISHYVADTYGIGVLVTDLFAIYDSLKNGSPMPAPTGSFEKILANDAAYRGNEELTKKDLDFFHHYYEDLHAEKPIYCGIHGNRADDWLKVKRKGQIAMPFYFVKCDTKGYRMSMPAMLGKAASEWCEENGISQAAFFMYTFAIATSLINDRAKYQTPLMLLDCRGTLADRKAAGTKVTAISVYSEVNYEKSFKQSMTEAFEDQQELYKHTRLSYLECEVLQHKLWGHSKLSQTYGFCFSFIPVKNPKGVRMQVLSNAKCSLPAYVAFMYDVETHFIDVMYDVQTMLIEPEVLADFHNTYLRVIESVLADPEKAMGQLF